MRNNAMFPIVFAAGLALLALAGCATSPERDRAPPTSGPATAVDEPFRGADAAATEERAAEAALMAVALIGTPYAARGASPDTGFDCSGLVAYVYGRALGVSLPRNTSDLSRAGVPVAAADLRPGDLVFYNTQHRAFSHVGIYLGEMRFVHAPSSGGAVRLENMRVAYWTRRFDGARRVAF
jgi:cell wall-associated NlpC family hydrolase